MGRFQQFYLSDDPVTGRILATKFEALVEIQLGGLQELVTTLVELCRCLQSICIAGKWFLCGFRGGHHS